MFHFVILYSISLIYRNVKILRTYWFIRSAITKYYKLSGLNNRNLLSYSSRDRMSRIKMSAGLVSLWSFSSAGSGPASCILARSSPWEHVSLFSVHVSKFSLAIKTPVLTGLKPILTASSQLNQPFKGPASK